MRSFLSKQFCLPLGNRVWSPSLWAVLLALVGMLLFCRLGFWQLGRAAEKTALAARYAARLHMAPVALADLLARGSDVDDVPVRLQGHYDNALQVYLNNQPYHGKAGFHVYTAFFPSGDRHGILIDRGWVEVAADMQALPPVKPATARDITGIAAMPSPFFTVGRPDYSRRPLQVSRLEIGQISDSFHVELRPFIIRLTSNEPDGLIRDWSPAARLGMPPEQHRAYAFQWFSLAAAVLGVLVVTNLRKSDNADNE